MVSSIVKPASAKLISRRAATRCIGLLRKEISSELAISRLEGVYAA